jgi:hypothetical protein
MKRNQHQVTSKSSRPIAAPQSKTAPRSRLAAGTVTCVWTGPDGRELFRTDFSRELFSLIEHTASKLGITLQRFFENAIHHRIKSQQVRRAA